MICYRDPADVRTIRRQSLLIILAFVIAAIAVVRAVYKFIQRPRSIALAHSFLDAAVHIFGHAANDG